MDSGKGETREEGDITVIITNRITTHMMHNLEKDIECLIRESKIEEEDSSSWIVSMGPGFELCLDSCLSTLCCTLVKKVALSPVNT